MSIKIVSGFVSEISAPVNCNLYIRSWDETKDGTYFFPEYGQPELLYSFRGKWLLIRNSFQIYLFSKVADTYMCMLLW